MKANSFAPLRRITLPPRTVHRPNRIRTKQINSFGPMVISSCAAVFLPAPRVMAKDEKPMKLNPMETKFVQKAATAGMAEVRIAELADKKAEAMMAAKDQPPSLPVPAPANDATREKQIPFRVKQKFAYLTDDDLPFVEGEDDELVGRPQKKLPVGQTKGNLYVS